GDKALTSKPEDIPSYIFPLDPTKDRIIYFKGFYISIVNKETNNTITYKDNENPITIYIPYNIPAGYTSYIRGGTVYFKP
ncbi:hypothetical protein P154DRAFT_420713, partial [Amniculicola lignicola CBS 123094]